MPAAPGGFPAPAAPAYGAPPGVPGAEVNPLGGTMVADPSAMAQRPLGPGGVPAAPGAAQPPVPTPGPYGAPPAGFPGAPPGAPAAAAPVPVPAQAIAPAAPGAMVPAAAPGALGPIGQRRNPMVVFVAGMICFVPFGLIMVWQMINELKSFRGKDDINPVRFLIPIINLIEMWKLPPKVLEAKQMSGVVNAQV
ncbi:MAG TPA: hypothetical protein VGJ84_03650, partial [Polyangiaceae bacterium]